MNTNDIQTMDANKQVEEFLLGCIKAGVVKAGSMVATIPAGLVQKKDSARTVDKGLQRLRRNGKIVFKNNVWSLKLREPIANAIN